MGCKKNSLSNYAELKGKIAMHVFLSNSAKIINLPDLGGILKAVHQRYVNFL